MSYTQANRPLRVTTALGEDALLLARLSGVEGVSMPFAFRLELLSENAEVAAHDVLRTPAAVTLRLGDDSERVVHGLVRRFVQLGQSEELTAYRAEIVPWLWFLSLSRESRIYQNLSVPEIVEQVFRDRGQADFELRLVKSYPPREYCVQYRETHLDFVSRLLAEEGIFYFFEHSADRHLLVLADSNGAAEPCPGIPSARMAPQSAEGGDDVVTELRREHRARPGKIALRDYDFLQPSLDLESALSAQDPEEVYDYPGRYTQPDEGERYARLRLEAQAARREVVKGAGTCRGFTSGCRFDLTDHYRDDANQAYLLLVVRHAASAGDWRSWNDTPMDYRNRFLAVPHAVPYRPPRSVRRPFVRGTQTALVVGPAGEEVWVDKHGRIKVQFYWDRVGKKDENSSCWIRVAQPWAGKGYGAVQIPRIGSEVVVEFLEGDPDRPLVTGCVYNAEQTPPFELPGAGIQMGMKSRSSPGGGGNNEISMTDTRGSEMMNIHAQFDMVTTVENDQTTTVHNNRTTTVDVDDAETVGVDQTLDVGSNQTITVGAAQSTTVGADRSASVGGSDSLSVSAGRESTIGADDTLSVGADLGISAAAKATLSSGADLALSTGANGTVTASGNLDLSAAKITLTAGGSSIEIGPGGIKITTGGVVDIKAAMIKDNC